MVLALSSRMRTMNLDDPIVIALIKLFAKHYRFFYAFDNSRYRLIVSWLTDDWTGRDAYKYLVAMQESVEIPWYAKSNNLLQLSGILRVHPVALYKKLKELENDSV
jgi:hypothetical protein